MPIDHTFHQIEKYPMFWTKRAKMMLRWGLNLVEIANNFGVSVDRIKRGLKIKKEICPFCIKRIKYFNKKSKYYHVVCARCEKEYRKWRDDQKSFGAVR